MHRTLRRLTTLLSAGAALVAALAVAAPVSADTAPITVTVDSPTSGATVSGTAVKVTYTVTTAPGAVVGWTGAGFAGAYKTNYIGDSCDTGCTITATFDSTAVPSAPTASDAGEYADGPQTISVNASSDGSSEGASVNLPVTLDNQRPSEQLDPPQPDPQAGIYEYTATDRLDVEAHPTVNDGGSVASMTFHYLSGGTREAAPLTPPVSAGAPWTLDLDTSTWARGIGSGWVTTSDDRGVSSIGTMVYYAVDRGMTLTGPAMSGTVDDFTLDAVKLQYAYPSVAPGLSEDTWVFPAQVTTYLDGTQVEQHSLVNLYPSDPPGVITARSGGRTPPGEHDLRYVVTDNRGVSNEVDYHLTVNTTLDIAWTSGPGQSILPGPLTLTGTADATDTTLQASTFYVDNRVLDYWACYTGDCPTHLDAVGKGQPDPEVYTPGQHQIRWEVDTKDGLPLTISGTITVLPYASTTPVDRAPATYGRVFAIAGRATLTDGRPAAGAMVTLQREPAEGGSWATIATSQADSTGTVTFDVRAARSSAYRMLTADNTTGWAGRAGSAITVESYANLVITHRPTSGRANRFVDIRGTVAPARDPIYVEVYRHQHWIIRAAVRPAADRTFSVRYYVYPGKNRVRLLRKGSANLLATTTPTWLITAR